MAEFEETDSLNLEGDDDCNFENSGSPEDIEFDMIVGAVEEIIMDESFSKMQTNFCIKHCDKFEDSDENKIIYTELFQEYTRTVEGSLEKSLKAKIEGFSMARFEAMLTSRKEELSGEIFDLLLSLGDFQEFKDMMLSYKRAKVDPTSVDGFSICGHHVN